MNRPPNAVQIWIAGHRILCDCWETNYYLGDVQIATTQKTSHLHVEVIPVSKKTGLAKNASFQGRLDAWHGKNDGCEPHLLQVPRLGPCFIYVEIYAQ